MDERTPPDDDFEYAPDPERPGWLSWGLREKDRYNSTLGNMWAQKRDDGIVVVRTEPQHLQGNLGNNVHGGAMLTQIDISLFVAARLHGALEHGPAVTLDLNTQFVGAGQLGQPMDSEVEIVKETGRLLFLRGLVTQQSGVIASFSGTIRKTPRPRS